MPHTELLIWHWGTNLKAFKVSNSLEGEKEKGHSLLQHILLAS